MNNQEAINLIDNLKGMIEDNHNSDYDMAFDMAIKALSQEPSSDAISRQAVLDELNKWDWQELYLPIHFKENIIDVVPSVNPQEPKTGHCKDCKWWKDSDGTFRRGIGAESRCPINREEVYEGKGYCFLYEPQETETWNGIHGQITAPKGTFERIFNDVDDDNDI